MSRPARCCAAPALTLLLTLARRGAPHGGAGHGSVFDYTALLACSACGGGVVEHHSHDCWDVADHASWDMYWWWRITADDMPLVHELAAACPVLPAEAACACPVHRGLGEGAPPGIAAPVETRSEPAPVPRARVRLADGVARWAEGAPGA
ncbi:hypothetical protein ACQB60_42825 [Actinomycetota bacterium Odt1-20B]